MVTERLMGYFVKWNSQLRKNLMRLHLGYWVYSLKNINTLKQKQKDIVTCSWHCI